MQYGIYLFWGAAYVIISQSYFMYYPYKMEKMSSKKKTAIYV